MTDTDDDLSIEARAHLQRLKGAPSGPPDAARERMRSRLAATLGDAMAPAEQSPNDPEPGTRGVSRMGTGASAGFGKGALLGALLGAVVGAGAEHARLAPRTMQSASVQSAPVLPAAIEPNAPSPSQHAAPVEPLAEPPAAVSPPTRKGAHEVAAPSERERLLVETARQALLRGDAAAAETAIAEHTRAFSRGALVEERDSLAIRVALLYGDLSSARKALASFETRYPQSLFTPTLRQSVRQRALGEP